MALSASRNTPAETLLSPAPVKLNLPVKDTVRIFPGAFVVLSAGYAAPATAATGLIAVGRAAALADNRTTVTGHADGFVSVDVEQGVFRWANSGSSDTIAQANVGADCYLVDDQTVALTDANGTRSLAGKIVGVDSSGVYVDTFIGIGAGAAGTANNPFPNGVISVPVTLSTVADTAVVARITPGFAGRILKTSFQATAAVTTGSKASTLTPNIAGVAVTGGVLALTSAGLDTLGKTMAGTAVTAANTFGATDELTFVASATTAFANGVGVLFIHLG